MPPTEASAARAARKATGARSRRPQYSSASTANRTPCAALRGPEGHWAWRRIEGRRCWYRGQAGKPKPGLYWPEPEAPPPPPLPQPRPDIWPHLADLLGKAPRPEGLVRLVLAPPDPMVGAAPPDEDNGALPVKPIRTLSYRSPPPPPVPRLSEPLRWMFVLFAAITLLGAALAPAKKKRTWSKGPMHDQKTIQAVFIRVCRDSGFTLGALRAASIAASTLKCHPLQVWLAMPSLDTMNEIAAGTHPILRARHDD